MWGLGPMGRTRGALLGPPWGQSYICALSYTSASLSLSATSTVIRVPQAGGGLSLPERNGWGRAGRTVWSTKLTSKQGWVGTCPEQCCQRDRGGWGGTRPLSLPSGLPEGSGWPECGLMSVPAPVLLALWRRDSEPQGSRPAHRRWDLRQRWHLPEAVLAWSQDESQSPPNALGGENEQQTPWVLPTAMPCFTLPTRVC